jgi:hypothetical protein
LPPEFQCREEVCSGETGYAETVRVRYDGSRPGENPNGYRHIPPSLFAEAGAMHDGATLKTGVSSCGQN